MLVLSLNGGREPILLTRCHITVSLADHGNSTSAFRSGIARPSLSSNSARSPKSQGLSRRSRPTISSIFGLPSTSLTCHAGPTTTVTVTMAYLDTNISPSAGTTTTFKRFKFDMSDICCNGCLIGAPEVQLFYWPVDLDSVDPPIATPPASSYSLVSDNFTL